MTTFEKKKEWYERPLTEVIGTGLVAQILSGSAVLGEGDLVDDPDYGYGGDIWN